jgi:5-methylcytosine-specific restriction endonuclease McrA
MTDAQTLVLDQGYRPIEIVHWTRAVTLFFQGKAEIVSEYDGFIRSTLLVIKIPAVVRLVRAFRRHKKPVKFSRVNIYGRDNYQCLYCGVKQTLGELTYDHVIPRSQGGKTTWTNIATACAECNGRKAGRTPEQAGMKLRKKPVQPVDLPAIVLSLSKESVPDAWRDFLYWTGDLDHD